MRVLCDLCRSISDLFSACSSFVIFLEYDATYRRKCGPPAPRRTKRKGWTQGQLASELGTSQSAIARMEQGKQNLSLRMIERLEAIFGRSIVKVGKPQMTHLRVEGGHTLSGEVDVNSSKNAGVALLCASLINRGTTTLRRLARIEEVNRIVEVLTSIGVECTAQRQRPPYPQARSHGP